MLVSYCVCDVKHLKKIFLLKSCSVVTTMTAVCDVSSGHFTVG